MSKQITNDAVRDYKARARNLRKLGFESYQQYLQSDLWKSIRSKIISRDNRKCVCCNGRATQVHHLSYGLKVLEGNRTGKLVAVCASCHRNAEYDGDTKVSVREASRRMSAAPPQKPSKRAARVRRPHNPDWDWYVSLQREARNKL